MSDLARAVRFVQLSRARFAGGRGRKVRVEVTQRDLAALEAALGMAPAHSLFPRRPCPRCGLERAWTRRQPRPWKHRCPQRLPLGPDEAIT